MHENCDIYIQVALKFVSAELIDKTPSFVKIMAWHQPGKKPLSE